LSKAPSHLEKTKLSDAIAALKFRDFRRFWFAGLASNSGGWLQGLAAPFIMYQMTQSGAWVGTSVFALMIPMALVGPFAGPMADRLSRRHILLIGVIASTNAVFWWAGIREPLAYIGINVIYGVANGFALPAWQAYVADLVPRNVLMNAITLNSTQFNAARAIGPSLGGVLLAFSGPGWAFLGNGVSFFENFETEVPRAS
jgi:MFS family permease